MSSTRKSAQCEGLPVRQGAIGCTENEVTPHRPVRAWTAAGFDEAIRLVYDASNVLNYGEPPDIGAYIAKCNESLGVGSIVVGQELAWEKREAVNANERERRQARGGAVHGRRTKYRPYGDPGPGLVARIEDWRPRTRKAKFTWFRKSAQWNRHDEVQCSITVSAHDLFNVSAYRMGDYLQFFKDPRTRAKYLKWAPLLMAAEDYHAGKIALGPQDVTYA